MIKRPAAPAKPASAPGIALLAWYDAQRRDLPWRAAPGTRADPYAVWLSEIMLQQTTVATVKGYYEAFLSRWPTIDALAAAPLEDVLAAWAGLGYYARARNLHACAGVVARDFGGQFPKGEEALLNLPGVGPYTAAAIAAIAFDAATTPVDGNVERVMARLYALETPPRQAKALIREKAHALLPLSPARPGDFAQALMDLGATVCTPRVPSCGVCPLAAMCEARKRGAQADFPAREPKRAKPLRRGAIFVLRRGDDVLLRRLPPKGLFGGMAAFPSTPLTQDVPVEQAQRFAPSAARWRACAAPVTHVFTHFALEATVFVADATTGESAPEGYFVSGAKLTREGLPTLMRKAALRAGVWVE